MQQQPLVSGVIIIYNGENFLTPAIESVLSQSYENWELLLVDDGSTDNSTQIAKDYAEKYPEKVRYLQHPNHENRGMSASRNLGIDNAKGEFIAFLDADDIWLPPKLEKQVAVLQSNPEAAMVYGRTQMWYGWTGKPEDIEHDRFRTLGVQANSLIQPPTLLNIFLKGQAETPATCGVLIRRKVIQEVGGLENNFRTMHEDQAFFAKICLQYPIFVEGDSWDKYRQHPDSSCNLALKSGEFNLTQMSPSYWNYLTWLEQYLTTKGFRGTETWKALQAIIFPHRNPLLYKLYNKILVRRLG
jgi:glycosyltransferase involved in cell wall biosynthesis